MAFTVTVAVAAAAVELAVSVSVELPVPFVPLGLTDAGVQLAVTPVGSPVTLSVTAVQKLPPVVIETASVTVLPFTTVRDAFATVSVSAGVIVTLSATLPVPLYTTALAASVTATPIDSVGLQIRAALLPVSVSVDCTWPFTSAAALHAPVTPAGKPVTVNTAPLGNVGETPPTSVTFASSVAVAVEFMVRLVAPSAIVIAGAGVTVSPTLPLALSPSPLALSVNVELPSVAVVVAVSVSVVEVVAAPALKLPTLHFAVTPAGKPLAVSATAPVKLPPVVTVTGMVVVFPATSVALVEPAAIASVGGANTVNASLNVLVKAPETPVTTTVPLPGVALVATAIVTVDVCPGFTLVGFIVTVTPVGAFAVSCTLPVKPPCPVKLNVRLALLPGSTLSLVAALVIAKPAGVPVLPPFGQFVTSTFASTEPNPVARLYAAPPAVNPCTPGTLLLPFGVAWKGFVFTSI